MLVFMKLAADFSRGCALLVIAHTFLLTHPYRLPMRELPPASISTNERDRRRAICPVRFIRYKWC